MNFFNLVFQYSPMGQKDALAMFHNYSESAMWLAPGATVIAFLPEIFFFLGTLSLFFYWYTRTQKLNDITIFNLKLQSVNTYSLREYIKWFQVLTLVTLFLLMVCAPLPVVGFIESVTLMFHFTFYTQLLKGVTLLLFLGFLFFITSYCENVLFPVLVDSRTQEITVDLRYREYFLLMGFGVGFTLLLISTAHLMSVALTMEGLSFCLYLLAGYQYKSRYGLEAAVKYFFYGAVVFGIYACGMLFIYLDIGGLSFAHIIANIPTYYEVDPTVLFLGRESIMYNGEKGSLLFMAGVLFIFASMLFKVGGAPFHFWVADVYEGSPYPTTAFMASIGKVGFFAILIKFCAWVFVGVLMEWQVWFFGAGALSLIIGGLGALMQKRIKRFLAYSSIVHVGFLLLALGIGDYSYIASVFLYDAGSTVSFANNALIFALLYLLVYVIMVLLLFCVLMHLKMRQTNQVPLYFTDLQGFLTLKGNKTPEMLLISVLLIVLIFSMAGIPPFVGFFTKFYVLGLLVKYKLNYLTSLVIIFTVVGAFYYLRLLKIFFFETSKQPKEGGVTLLGLRPTEVNGKVVLAKSFSEVPLFIIALSLFVILIALPWKGGLFMSFDVLEQSALAVCWPELPVAYARTTFVNTMLPYLCPFPEQYLIYALQNPSYMGNDLIMPENFPEEFPRIGDATEPEFVGDQFVEQIIEQDYLSFLDAVGRIRRW